MKPEFMIFPYTKRARSNTKHEQAYETLSSVTELLHGELEFEDDRSIAVRCWKLILMAFGILWKLDIETVRQTYWEVERIAKRSNEIRTGR